MPYLEHWKPREGQGRNPHSHCWPSRGYGITQNIIAMCACCIQENRGGVRTEQKKELL